MTVESTYKITIAYDGTAYAGWQMQRGQTTIQGAIEAGLARIAGRRVVVCGASRTDSGVHARGQVAGFSWASRIPAERIPMALNSALPRDIRVLACEEAPGFDARRDSRGKVYTYTIDVRPVPDPFLRHFAAHVPGPLDRAAMDEAAVMLRGCIDLSCFAAVEAIERLGARGAYREIFAAEWTDHGTTAVFTIGGDGFLRHSIRSMVGAMVWIGRGQLTLSELRSVMSSQSRIYLRAPAMPARGLCLEEVRYEEPGPLRTA